MIRCCLCRERPTRGYDDVDWEQHYEQTDLPGTGLRCRDHAACADRVREIVNAHIGLAEIVGSGA